MARAKEERYLEWLEREEESLGLDDIVRASGDIDYARGLLKGELGYDPTEAQMDAFFVTAKTKYQVLPSLNVSYERIEHTWGFQSVYRDMATGRFISREETQKRLTGEG